ncbi:MAG: hypothetical protein WC551_11775 [Patescibacteria group bacterium]
MKDLMFIIPNHRSSLYERTASSIAKAIQGLKPKPRQLLDRAWLLTGPMSFQIAIQLSHIAVEYETPYVLVEVESVLVSPEEVSPSNTPAPPE